MNFIRASEQALLTKIIMKEPHFKIQAIQEEEFFGKYVFEPLDQGYGQTLGNALRRVLLTSLPGAGVTTVKIDGVKHQFSTLPGMKEDVLELILNIKKLRLRLFSEKPQTIHLSVHGQKKILASDIETPAEVEVVNKDFYLASLSGPKAKLEIEMTVERGFGYSLSEERKVSTIGVIPIDVIFTPVLRVNYKVEATRVGQLTDLDKLILEITTDGTINPKEALEQSAKILVAHFTQIYEPKEEPEESVVITPSVSEDILKMTIDELDLPTRIYNSLKNGGIETIGQLLGTPKRELISIRNMGGKSITLIEEKLREKGVALTV